MEKTQIKDDQLSSKRYQSIRKKLLAFYDCHRRDLPWRRTRDPYAIWVSEIMLQQTQVKTVVPRYVEFLQEYPNVEALAAVDETPVCESWAGLGYYRRARLMHKAARQIVHELGGIFPQTARELQQLAGVGRYTAGAIASIAFDACSPVVDGNVERVLCRLDALEMDPKSPAGVRALWTRAEALVQGARPGDLNQALMELGALVCTPRDPRCPSCPLRDVCMARKLDRVSQLPAVATRSSPKPLRISFAWFDGPRGVWLRQRPLDGLWPGLWELPGVEGGPAALSQSFNVSFGRSQAKVQHTLTHRRVTATVHIPSQWPRLRSSKSMRCYTDPLSQPLSALARKTIRAMQE